MLIVNNRPEVAYSDAVFDGCQVLDRTIYHMELVHIHQSYSDSLYV